MAKMLHAQYEIIIVARKTLGNRDETHTAKKQYSPSTMFPINSYVLVDYIDQPRTTLHTPLESPLTEISSNNGQYTLLNIVTEKLSEYHVSRLRPFYYDNEDLPRLTANRET